MLEKRGVGLGQSHARGAHALSPRCRRALDLPPSPLPNPRNHPCTVLAPEPSEGSAPADAPAPTDDGWVAEVHNGV